MKNFAIIFVVLTITSEVFSQGVRVSSAPGSLDPSSILEAQSTSQGFLPPRMTSAQRDAITNPARGLRIYNLDTDCENFYNGTTWRGLCGTCLPEISTPTASTHNPTDTEIEWNWSTVSGADGYKYNTANDYGTATDVGSATTYAQTGLSASTAYTLYVWAYNICGGSATSVELSSTTTSPPCTVGTIGPGGGYIFYCGSAYPGYTGLEAAASNQSAGAPWGCHGTAMSGADGASIGSGNQNTSNILSECATAGIAARICGDLDEGGFDDWFLPSLNELSLMYTNLHQQSLGSFTETEYWSSTEHAPAEQATNARTVRFYNGNPDDSSKNNSFSVRAVRRF